MLIFILFVIILMVGAYYVFRWLNANPVDSKAAKPLTGEEYSEELSPTDLSKGRKYANWVDDPPLYLNENIPQIHVMVKDPDWLYAYWHWGLETPKVFDLHYGPGSWEGSAAVLRYHQLASGSSFDIHINSYANCWYIPTLIHNTSVTVFLGRLLNGQFIQLAASNQATIPISCPSGEIDPKWQPLFSPGWHSEMTGDGTFFAEDFGAPSSRGISSWGKGRE